MNIAPSRSCFFGIDRTTALGPYQSCDHKDNLHARWNLSAKSCRYKVSLGSWFPGPFAISVNFWTTILNLRSYYLSLKTIPLFPWSLLITGGMLLLTLPILSGALLMVLADLHSNTLFFDPIFGSWAKVFSILLLSLLFFIHSLVLVSH